jgi:hypothetical protein
MAQEFDLGSIRGPQGEMGLPGPPGPMGSKGDTPQITVGITTTLAPGLPAAVSRRDGSPDCAPVFDFAIPSGGMGDMRQSVYDPHNRHQDIFAYVDANAGRRAATKIIAAADSQDKSGADYLCDGESDQLILRQAVHNLPPTGGKIQLLDGTYHFDTVGISPSGNQYCLVNMEIPNITIAGMGMSSIITLDDAAAMAGSSYQLLRSAAEGFCLENVVLDGNSQGNPGAELQGLRLNFQSSHSKVSNCLFRNCSVCAIDNQAEQVIISQNIIEGCGDGLRLQGGMDVVYGNILSNCAGRAIYGNSGEHIIVHNRLSNSGETAIYLELVSHSDISHNLLVGQPLGIALYLSDFSALHHNMIRRKTDSDSYAAAEYSIHLSSCSNLLIVGNIIRGKAVVQDAACSLISKHFSGTDWNISS